MRGRRTSQRFGFTCLVLWGCAHAAPPPAAADAPVLDAGSAKSANPAPLPPRLSPEDLPLDAKAGVNGATDLYANLDAGAAPPAAPKGSPPAPEPTLPDPRAAADEVLAQAVNATAGVDARVCQKSLRTALRRAALASPDAHRSTLATLVACDVRGTDLKAARKDASTWLLACGPDAVDRCREEGLERLAGLAEAPPVNRALARRVEALREADRCIARGEKSSAPPEPCLAKAESVYRAAGDALLLQRLALAKLHARSKGQDGPSPSALRHAIAACREPRCRETRTRALAAFADWAKAHGKLELELTQRLLRDRAEAEGMAPAARAHVRSAETVDACDRLDASAGEGRCHALERKVTKGWAYRDFSQASVTGDLPMDQILATNREYLPTLGACFRAEAERRLRSREDAQRSFELTWMIGNDGRVARFEPTPALDPQSPLQQCLAQAFALWRYPRSTGENQHVTQTFGATAVER